MSVPLLRSFDSGKMPLPLLMGCLALSVLVFSISKAKRASKFSFGFGVKVFVPALVRPHLKPSHNKTSHPHVRSWDIFLSE